MPLHRSRIGDLTALEVLEVDDNNLQTLPERIGDLSALKVLVVYDNKLEALPDRIGDLSASNSSTSR